MAIAQTPEQIKAIQDQSDMSALKALALKADSAFKAEKARAWQKAKELGWETRTVSPNGRVKELIGLQEDGSPKYYVTYNLESAQTIGVNKVWSGGASGFNLSGRGMKAHEWDGSGALSTHQEFTGRLTRKDGLSNDPELSVHSTHVAGTIIAKGIRADAKGMAYEANLDSYDWASDVSEMSQAANAGALVSNHSYGTPAGFDGDGTNATWYGLAADTLEDRHNGQYGSQALSFDQVCVSAPYYLPCIASGNSRGAGPNCGATKPCRVRYHISGQTGTTNVWRPNNGDYDQISSYAAGKNVLTVGATSPIPAGYSNPASVRTAYFSSAGPMDDGRIKPDISADGMNVVSSSSSANDGYDNLQGTSMATPSVTGALLLLQQQYSNTHRGKMMRAATLKGLAIHTADEAGSNPGPDYVYGWGLLNANTAASLIAKDSISAILAEKTLANHAVNTYQITSSGSGALKVTISWTDPTGPLSPNELDNRAYHALVNDLDLRLLDPNGDTVKPWVLDPTNETAAATLGDNISDNVEQVYIASPQAGTYTVIVNHKRSLKSNLAQNYALFISGISPLLANNPLCRPLTNFKASSGTFTDGSAAAAKYGEDLDCIWIPDAGNTPRSVIQLTFTRFNVAAGDTVYVHQGNSLTGALLGKFSGTTIPPVLVGGLSGKILVHFKTNAGTADNGTGWSANFKIYTMPKVSFASNTRLACPNSNIQLNVQNNSEDTAGTRYTWTLPGSVPVSGSWTTVTVKYPSPGVYAATLKATNPAGDSVVVKSDYIIIADRSFGPVYYEPFSNANNFPEAIQPEGSWSTAASDPSVTDTYTWTDQNFYTEPAAIQLNNSVNAGLQAVNKSRDLISPIFDLSGHDSVMLSFNMAFARTANNNTDKFLFYTSTDCGATWVNKKNYTNTSTVKPYTIPTIITDIPWFANDTDFRLEKLLVTGKPAHFRFKFTWQNGGGNYFYLDDVRLELRVGDTTGIARQVKGNMGLSLYPNPVTQGSVIEYTLDKAADVNITITDMTGRTQTFSAGRQNAGEYRMPFEKLVGANATPGMYLIQLNAGGRLSAIKGTIR